MENLSLKLVVTAYRKGILTCMLENGTAVQLDYNNGSSVVGSIYAGKVRSVSKNLEAAFVDIGTPLPGYLPLSGEMNCIGLSSTVPEAPVYSGCLWR